MLLIRKIKEMVAWKHGTQCNLEEKYLNLSMINYITKFQIAIILLPYNWTTIEHKLIYKLSKDISTRFRNNEIYIKKNTWWS